MHSLETFVKLMCICSVVMLKPWNPRSDISVTFFFKSELVMLHHISGPQDTSEHEVHPLKLASETKQKFTDKALLTIRHRVRFEEKHCITVYL